MFLNRQLKLYLNEIPSKRFESGGKYYFRDYWRLVEAECSFYSERRQRVIFDSVRILRYSRQEDRDSVAYSVDVIEKVLRTHVNINIIRIDIGLVIRGILLNTNFIKLNYHRGESFNDYRSRHIL